MKRLSKKLKITLSLAAAVCILCAVVIPILASKGYLSDGNSAEYSVEATRALADSPLAGKTVIFLGSSVTYGSASRGESFVEFLEKRDGIIPVKEAVSGTTLVDNGSDSYIARMKTIDKSAKADAFVCQLSTNDATKKLPLGEISASFDMDGFDTSTVAGALEYVIAYARQTWNCPILFYTGTRYDSERYGEMVALLLDISEKWNVTVIDLWNNVDLNDISADRYKTYMANGIHPTRAGYRDWWLPEFEKALNEIL